MHFAQRIFYGLLPVLAIATVVARAQPTKDAVEPTKSEPREPVRDVDVQQRRSTLRASLKMQPEIPPVRESRANTSRLLSDQERADLRQQLRKQEGTMASNPH
jgi:hypothetical protein